MLFVMCLCYSIPVAAGTSGPCHVKCDLQVITHPAVTVQPITVLEVAALPPDIVLLAEGRDYFSWKKAGLIKPLTSTAESITVSEVTALAHIALAVLQSDNFDMINTSFQKQHPQMAQEVTIISPSSTASFETST